MSYVKQVETPHYCEPPRINGEPDDWEFPESESEHALSMGAPRLRPGVRLPHAGDVWACPDCDTTWVCFHRPTQVGGTTVIMGGNEWRKEGRWERKRREKRERKSR